MALTVEEMFLAMKSRWIGGFNQKATRNIIAGRMGFIFKKSFLRYEEVYKAMVSRGFTGEITIKSNERINLKEACILVIFIGTGVLICLIRF
jgi:energy-coupling factor transporter transmembrane protein EcfT